MKKPIDEEPINNLGEISERLDAILSRLGTEETL